MQPVEAFVLRQHQLELQKKRTVVSSALNELFFEHLLDKDATKIDWELLQAVQTQHDAHYHSDVVYPGPQHHLAHNVQHLTMVQGKILKAMLDADRTALREHYISAMIFGVKSLTALNIRLPATTGSPRIWGEIVR